MTIISGAGYQNATSLRFLSMGISDSLQFVKYCFRHVAIIPRHAYIDSLPLPSLKCDAVIAIVVVVLVVVIILVVVMAAEHTKSSRLQFRGQHAQQNKFQELAVFCSTC